MYGGRTARKNSHPETIFAGFRECVPFWHLLRTLPGAMVNGSLIAQLTIERSSLGRSRHVAPLADALLEMMVNSRNLKS
jgi:hypothetical protein